MGDDDHGKRLAVVEVKIQQVEEWIGEIRRDVRDIRDTVVGARFMGALVVGVVAVLGGVAGWFSRGAAG